MCPCISLYYPAAPHTSEVVFPNDGSCSSGKYPITRISSVPGNVGILEPPVRDLCGTCPAFPLAPMPTRLSTGLYPCQPFPTNNPIHYMSNITLYRCPQQHQCYFHQRKWKRKREHCPRISPALSLVQICRDAQSSSPGSDYRATRDCTANRNNVNTVSFFPTITTTAVSSDRIDFRLTFCFRR